MASFKSVTKWEKAEEQDHKLLRDALGMVQDNVSLALSYIQAQLLMQSAAALIITERSEGAFPIEIQRAVWDNAIDLERKLQSWWTLVNFTCDPITNMATAFVLVCSDTIYVNHHIILLRLNHEGTALYPSRHRLWA